jgi:hypothetical protein
MRRLNLVFIDMNPKVHNQWQVHYQNIVKSLDQYGVKYRNEYVYHFQNSSIHSLLLGDTNFGSGSRLLEDSNINKLVEEHNSGKPSNSRLEKTLPFGKSAVMTPTNSLSYMGGGFDRYLVEALLKLRYHDFKTQLQTYCLNKFQGYTPVNTVNSVNLLEALDDYSRSQAYKSWNLTDLICIPSMVVPEAASSTQGPTNIFDTIWNLLLHIENELVDTENVIIPGIGTGYGNLDTNTATYSMLMATFIFNLQLSTKDPRLRQLKKSLLILFLFNKNYKDLINIDDLQELEKDILTEYGAGKTLRPGEMMDIDDILKCIQW